MAVNDEGMVIGRSDTDDGGISHAVMWQNGRITEIDGVATAINSQGEVLGHSNGPFVWSPDQLWEIGFIKGAMSVTGHGIDREGRVLGTADGQPFLWHRGQFEWLPNPTIGRATAGAISDDGRFVVGGHSSPPDLQTSRPMVWTRQ